jgi:hypothetical protein
MLHIYADCILLAFGRIQDRLRGPSVRDQNVDPAAVQSSKDGFGLALSAGKANDTARLLHLRQ